MNEKYTQSPNASDGRSKFSGYILSAATLLMLLVLLLANGVVRAQTVISTFAPASGAIGSSVTIMCAGFNTTSAQNMVEGPCQGGGQNRNCLFHATASGCRPFFRQLC